MSFFFAFIKRQFFVTPPIPTASFKSKIVIVTGSNTGLGLEAVRWIVRLGASRVILACRNTDKGNAAAMNIQNSTGCSPDTLEVWKLDMSSYASVIAFAERAKIELPRLDALLANAGMMKNKFTMTEDNEESITTNVVSTALLSFLLHPKLRETAQQFGTPTHLTLTASELYQMAKFKERNAPYGRIFATLNDENKANMGDRYNVTKLLDVFIVKQIGAMSSLQASGVIVNCVAPGFCHSELGREYSGFAVTLMYKMFARTSEVGSRTLVHGASAGPESHGQYVPDCKITPTEGLCKGRAGVELQNRIWLELKDKLERIHTGVTKIE